MMIKQFSYAFRINDTKFLNTFRSLSYVNVDIKKHEETLKKMDVPSLLANISNDIKTYLKPQSEILKDIVHYSFSSNGKMMRPHIIILTAASFNYHYRQKCIAQSRDLSNDFNSIILESQYKIALIGEMIHTASLMHDDLIDCSDIRRGVISSHKYFGPENAILGGDYILICASQMLARIGNTEVVSIISELINDLIKGEIMQLTSYDNIDEKLSHYYKKTYRKTASLIANSCKAVTLLTSSHVTEDILEAAFEFGRNIGMTFQLIDDILDVTSSEEQLGKPSGGADMKLGLATGPVLFASEKFPEVHDIISRRLCKKGDLEQMLEYIKRAKGIEETKVVAQIHKDNAMKILRNIDDSPYRKMLENLSEEIFNRTR